MSPFRTGRELDASYRGTILGRESHMDETSLAQFIKEIGRGAKSAGNLSRNDARSLFSAMLGGLVPDLQLGAILIALRVKGESLEELAGFLAAAEASYNHLPMPSVGTPVVIPTYNGARHLPNLVPLLALLLARAGMRPDQPLVLTVSRIAPQKDLPTLVQAARLSRVPATWVVVGDGDERLRARLEQEADGIRQREGEGPVVRFVGARTDVGDWLRAADAFVLTSRWEARALVVQEAMAAGLPVVVTRTGGLPDLVGDAGCLVAVGDPSAVAAQVDLLLADPENRARRGAEARARAATWATPDAETRRWVDRYAADPVGMT